ncbi:MAG: peptidoglycan DD-metalloendopeptidase family protein [Ruminococcus sp.]|nr:peptidoglycan DD-metalloendopeptidase family protein [Ruminococcus sp.]
MTKRILSALLAVIIVLSAVATASADTLSDLKNEQSRLEQEAAEYEAIIAEKEGQIAEQEEYVNTIALKVANINDQIYVNREKIAAYDAEISVQEAEKDRLNAKAEENMNILRKRLRAIYMAGDTSALEIILGASDFSDFVDKMQLVESLSDYDAKLIDEIETQLDDVNETVEALNKNKSELEVEKAALESNQAELDSLLAENEEALKSLYGQKQEYEDHVHSIELSQSEVDQKIQDYYDSLRQEAGGSSSGGSYEEDNPPYSGNYVWPAPGHYWLSSKYYEERTGYYHGGIDIAGSGFMGTPIVASASGTIISACNSCEHNWGKYGSCGCGGGYGNYVWIDHGGGKATIYAHMSYIVAFEGEYVTAGQLLGYGGSTGSSTGPHLHFECRYYGTRYDPMTELN